MNSSKQIEALEATPWKIAPRPRKSISGEQLTTWQTLANAFAKSFVVSVFPVPAGPAGRSHFQIQRLRGRHIDAVRQGDNETKAIAQVLVVIRQNRIWCYLSALSAAPPQVRVAVDKARTCGWYPKFMFQLGCPLEVLLAVDTESHFLDDVGVGIHGYTNHHALPIALGKIRSS